MPELSVEVCTLVCEGMWATFAEERHTSQNLAIQALIWNALEMIKVEDTEIEQITSESPPAYDP